MARDARELGATAGQVWVWDSPDPADVALAKEIMASNRVVGAMHHAWAMSKREGREKNFWIYRNERAQLATGRIWTGTSDATPLEAYNERLFLEIRSER